MSIFCWGLSVGLYEVLSRECYVAWVLLAMPGSRKREQFERLLLLL